MSIPEDQLAPCPFCAGKAYYQRVGTTKRSCIVRCMDCSCTLETGEVFNCGAAWNTRWSVDAAMAEQQARRPTAEQQRK